MALVLIVVVGSQIAAVVYQLDILAPLLPVYGAFLCFYYSLPPSVYSAPGYLAWRLLPHGQWPLAQALATRL